MSKKISGTKFDKNKPPINLIPKEAVMQEALAFKYGAGKYGRYNFMGGIEFTRLLGAALRHIFQYLNGEDLDDETGLPHWAHARACLSMLAWMEKYRGDLDDRWIKSVKLPKENK